MSRNHRWTGGGPPGTADAGDGSGNNGDARGGVRGDGTGHDDLGDDRVAQFLVSVGSLCRDAHLGGYDVRLRLLDGGELLGVPEPPADTDADSQLGNTGFADQLSVGGVVVALSDVAEASIRRPRG